MAHKVIYFHNQYWLLFHSIYWHTEHINFKAYALNPVFLYHNGNAMQPYPIYKDPSRDINKMTIGHFPFSNIGSVFSGLYLTFMFY